MRPSALTDDESAFVAARRRDVQALVDAAPPPWAAWARSQLPDDVLGPSATALPGGRRTASPGGRRTADGGRPSTPKGATSWDLVRDADTRASLGQWFTPAPIATALAALLGDDVDDVLDPACGAGSLLLAVLDRRRKAGQGTASALAAVEGWDRDPVAAFLCRCALVEWALAGATGDVPGPLRVATADGLSRETSGRGAVIANPPFLEAKRMRKAEPGLRERLRRDFPDLGGAVDLYLAFAWRALGLVHDGGDVAVVLPNKVLEGRYATSLRRRIASGEVDLLALADLSRLSPRPFPGTGVYPVLLHLRTSTRRTSAGTPSPETSPRPRVRVHRAVAPEDVDVPKDAWTSLDPEALLAWGGEHPLFVPFETWPDLAPLLALPRLGDVARVASTVSFHAKGLRERYVGDVDGPPYLGGRSFTRKNEVEPFRIRWGGARIRYDNDALRADGNPLPDVSLFRRPKAIFCQHATRMTVAMDAAGRFVTKDTYPVAWPTDPRWTLETLVAVLSSTVFTALYNTAYQGILIGGETYHYLPAFLHTVPVPPIGDLDVDDDVRRLSDGDGPVDRELWDDVDRRVTRAYGVDEAARQRLITVHLDRVSAERPGRRG